MRFLNDAPPYDLTYSDVFMVPSLSAVPSRFDVDLSTPDGVGTTIPVVVANMTAIAGRRMAETVARRGGLTVLPQDIPLDITQSVVDYVKSRHPVYETPITLTRQHTVGDALGLIHKRSHGAVVVVDDDRPVGIFTERDAVGFDRFTQLQNVMSTDLITVAPGVTAQEIFDRLSGERLTVAPVLDENGRLLGCVTRKGALRSTIYKPALDAGGRLLIGVAVGINGDPAIRGEVVARNGRRRAGHRYCPRPSNSHATGDRRGARSRAWSHDRRRKYRHRRCHPPTYRRGRRHSESWRRTRSDVYDPDD